MIKLSAGDTIRIKEMNGNLIKEGILAQNPSGSIYSYDQHGESGTSYQFTDTVFFMENKKYRLEIVNRKKEFTIKPLPVLVHEDSFVLELLVQLDNVSVRDWAIKIYREKHPVYNHPRYEQHCFVTVNNNQALATIRSVLNSEYDGSGDFDPNQKF